MFAEDQNDIHFQWHGYIQGPWLFFVVFFLQRLETIVSLASYSYMDSLQLLHSLFPTSRRSTLLEERYFKWAEHSSTIELRNKTASLVLFQLLLTSTAAFAAATTKTGVLNLFFPVVLDQKKKALFFCSFSFLLLGLSSLLTVFCWWPCEDIFLCGFNQPLIKGNLYIIGLAKPECKKN